MAFSDDIPGDLVANQFNTDEHAQTITYGGSSISAIVNYQEHNPEAAIAEITVQVSDVATPTYRDPVVIGSITWRVSQTLGGDRYTWNIEIVRDERITEP